MFKRSAGSPRAYLSAAYLAALAGCATAEEVTLPNNEPPAAGAPGFAGATASAGSHAGGSLGSGATGGAASGGNGAAGSTNSGAAGSTSSAGSHAGGSVGAAGSLSAGGRAGAGAGAGAGSAGTSSSGGAGAQLFSDDFEDGAADGWINAGGTWAIASDGSQVYAQQATGTGSTLMLSANGSTTWTDQIVEARIKVLAFGGQSSSYFAAIYARFSTASYYALTLRSDGKVAIRKGNSTIGSAVTAGITAGTWYTVRLEVVGTTLKAYVDGVLKVTQTDSSIAAGGIAVSAVNASAEFDNIKVNLP